MRPRAAVYIRVSTASQVEKWGLPAQRRALQDECERQGWDAAEVYEDAGISGETLGARPAMGRLLDDVRRGGFDIVLAVEWERFSRSQHGRDWSTILGAVEEGCARLAVPGQILDPASPDDGFLAGLFGLLSAREKRKMVQRTSRGIRERVRAEKWWGSLRPFGYVVGDDGHLVIHADEALVVRRVFALVRAGEPLGRVAVSLNQDCVATHKGGREWRSNTVKRLVENPVYAGRLHYGRTTKTPRGGSEILVEGAHEPIIPPHEFDQLASLRAARKRAGFPKSRWDRGFILTGLLTCPTCGRRMYGSSSGKPTPKCPKTVRYDGHRSFGERPARCRKVRADALEAAVLDEVARALSGPGVADAVRRQLVGERLREGTSEARERGELEAALTAEEAKIEALYTDRVSGLITPAQFKAWNETSVERQRTVRQELRALEDRMLSLGRHADVEALVGQLEDIGRVLGALEPEELKRLLVELVREVRIDGEGVSVEWRLPGLGATEARGRGDRVATG